MGDLEIGERLQGTSGPVTITSTHLVAQTQNVYNIEVQGEHVYEVTELGILVHNTNDLCKQIEEIQDALLKDPTNKDLLKKQADLKKHLDDLAPKSSTSVYRSVDAAGNVTYVGITNHLARRAAEHLRTKGIQIERLLGRLSRSDAKALEQALIEHHGLGTNGGTLLNKINSIAASNPAYAAQLRRGLELLESIGY